MFVPIRLHFSVGVYILYMTNKLITGNTTVYFHSIISRTLQATRTLLV